MTNRSCTRLRRIQLAGLLGGAALASAVTLQASSAAFAATTENGPSVFHAAGLDLVDDDSASIMFDLNELVPGDTHVKCIEVDYTGTTFHTTDVKLYATEVLNENNFADHIDIEIEVGTGGTFGDCSGFVTGSTIVASSPLSTITTNHTDFASGVSGYTPASGSTARAFRFTARLGVDTPDSAQGDTANATFTWEIQSS